MKAILASSALVIAFGVAPVWATMSDPFPPNPCLGAGKLKANLDVLDVSGDGSLPPPCPNGVFAETAITCTSKEKAAVPVDIAIEYFDASGATISPAIPVTACALAPGGTVTFATSPAGLPLSPWAGAIFVPTAPVFTGAACAPATPGCFLHGSARVLATSKKVQCTATRIDFTSPCIAGGPLPLSVKNLTIINKAKQAGD